MITWSISGMSSPRAARSVHTKNCCSPSRNLSRFACLETERGNEKEREREREKETMVRECSPESAGERFKKVQEKELEIERGK